MSRAMPRPSRHLLLGLGAVLVAAGCASDPELGRDEAAVAPPITITVNADGTFSPAVRAINEGDTVTFITPPGTELRTTDAIVRVTGLQLLLANLTGNACMTTGQAYDTTHVLPGDDNELTGPLRRGTSGIYALGPEEHEGFLEGPITDSCDTIATAAGIALPIVDVETWVETTSFEPAATTRLCRKHAIEDDGDTGSVTGTNSAFLLDSTWDNPDLAGAVVRINWEDLYALDLTRLPDEVYVPDWTILDHELDQAARRGKVVLLEVLAGDGIPPWLFADYAVDDAGVPTVTVDAAATGLGARTVIPIKTRDFGSQGGPRMPRAGSCGYEKTMGSPADPAYQAAVVAMIRAVAVRIRANGAHYQALGSFKVTGLNFLTGEMRLPQRCLDPSELNVDNGNPQTQCWCHTRIWAAPLGEPVLAYDDPDPGDDIDPPTVTGGGYSAAIAQNFIRTVENTLYVELGRRKTMHYMLIQDGLPKVDDEEHYAMDSIDGQVGPWTSPWGATNHGYVDAAGDPIGFARQTQDALDSGRLGEFKRIFADGSPDPVGGDEDAHALFAVMHAAIGPVPLAPAADAKGVAVGGVGDVPDCAQQREHPAAMLVNGLYEAALRDPGLAAPGSFNDETSYGQPGDGCPNKWAVREGYRNQVIGFQTTNDLAVDELDGHHDLSATLWNATLNSNAVFLEAYEAVLWKAEQSRRAGNPVLSTTIDGYAEIPERQKTLAQWAAELHKRRRSLATLAGNDTNRHMKDPFPASYTFHFKKNLAAGQLESYRFVNPAARCAAGTLASGRIDVTGL
jgi:hypothetical protein